MSGMGGDNADGWRLGTRAVPDSPHHPGARHALAALRAPRDSSLGGANSAASGSFGGAATPLAAEGEPGRAGQLEAALSDVRARITSLEEDVLALEFAASAPDDMVDLPVTFQNQHLQVGCATMGLWPGGRVGH